jgi:hypothetical protein
MILTVSHDVLAVWPCLFSPIVVSHYFDVSFSITVQNITNQDHNMNQNIVKGRGYCRIKIPEAYILTKVIKTAPIITYPNPRFIRSIPLLLRIISLSESMGFLRNNPVEILVMRNADVANGVIMSKTTIGTYKEMKSDIVTES